MRRRDLIKKAGIGTLGVVGITGTASADCFDNRETDSDESHYWSRQWDAHLDSDLTVYRCTDNRGPNLGCGGSTLNIYSTSQGDITEVRTGDGNAESMELTTTLSVEANRWSVKGGLPDVYDETEDEITRTVSKEDADSVRHDFSGIELCVEGFDKVQLIDELAVTKEGKTRVTRTNCEFDLNPW